MYVVHSVDYLNYDDRVICDNHKEGRKDAKESSETEENVEEQQLFIKDSAAADDDHHDIENPHVPLLTSLRKKLKPLSPLSSHCSIYKVPRRLLVKNPSAYSPRIVSIGPMHHRRKDLEAMEEYKQRFFAGFLERAQLSLEKYVEFVKDREEKLRSCYADTIQIDSDKLMEIVMVDAAFTVLLLVTFAEGNISECFRIFNKPYYISSIIDDIFLLENQLPLFIIEELFAKIEIKINSSSKKEADEGGKGQEDEEETKGGGGEEKGGGDFFFIKLVCQFVDLRGDIGAEGYDPMKVKNRKIEHFLDCLWVCHQSSKEDSPVKEELQIPSRIPTATELHQAGVRFAKHSSTHLFDIEFRDGVLSIPQMFMGDYTESLYRNLLAFEQCHYLDDSRFTAYFCFMDQLIDSPKDIDLLVKCGIIDNTLGDSLQAVNIFNSLAQGLLMTVENHYAYLREQLQTYCKEPSHKLKAALRQHYNTWKIALRKHYLNTPWVVISVIAAVILLVLTAVQTVFAVIS
ncbi:hypothetical protein CDL15_Pgr015732 [Punica granatum]|uniref:Uncharacterized protein n=1 Tax=Punica granatum TaxID=22663 RepID=A0A218XPY7_PUNGR|nr:hypothetical protein CDL15_Pgr015732 [Punica granatum]